MSTMPQSGQAYGSVFVSGCYELSSLYLCIERCTFKSNFASALCYGACVFRGNVLFTYQEVRV